ncbi:MAG: glycosyltransferase family 4 protein [Candidatus Competibacteraceae bacterium]
MEGWQAHDAGAPYQVYRLELLRPLAVESRSRLYSLWLFLTSDLPLKLKVLLETLRIIHHEGINLICVGELNSISWLGLICQRWLGIKMINYIHGEEVITELGYRNFDQRRRNYLHRTNAIVAVSQFTRNVLVNKMGVDPDKIELICNGVDLDRFQPAPKDKVLLERYHLQGKRIILTVGRLVERKGIDMTLRALPRVLAQYPDSHYLIIGKGPYQSTLETLAHTLQVEDHVTFAGAVPNAELVAHYCLCDLFVMPNRELADYDTEGFGLVFLEANACGKAVIGGRAGGAVEAVRDGENGLLVDGMKPDEIAAAIIRLLGEDTLRQRLEQQGLTMARAAGLERGARRFQALCRRLLDQDGSA